MTEHGHPAHDQIDGSDVSKVYGVGRAAGGEAGRQGERTRELGDSDTRTLGHSDIRLSDIRTFNSRTFSHSDIRLFVGKSDLDSALFLVQTPILNQTVLNPSIRQSVNPSIRQFGHASIRSCVHSVIRHCLLVKSSFCTG